MVDLSDAYHKIRLANNTWFTVRYLAFTNMRRRVNLGRAPGMDIFVPLPRNERAYIYLERAAGTLYTCMPNATHYQGVATALRPPEWPGPQLAGPLVPTAPGCQQQLNASGYDNATGAYVPALSRCYAAAGQYYNTATYGYYVDPVSGLPVADGYRVIYANVTFLCKALLTDACVRQFGPYGCWLRYCQSILAGATYCSGAWPPPPPPPAVRAAVPESPDEGRTSSHTHVIVASVVGGVCGALLLAALAWVATVWLARRRQSSANPVPGFDHGIPNLLASYPGAAASSTKGASSSSAVAFASLEAAAGGGNDAATTAAHQAPSSAELTGSGCTSTSAGDGYTTTLSSKDGVLRDANGSPLVVVTPLTPHRPDVRMEVEHGTELQLLPQTRGRGSFGRVVVGMYQGQKVAVKLVTEAYAIDPEVLAKSFAQEVEVLARCCHPNVVRLLAACLTPPRLCLVMELMDTSLDKLIHRDCRLLPLPTVLDIACDIASGLAYLHPTIVHRDLKPANVLINGSETGRPVAKLTDFGLSRLRTCTLVTQDPEAGTPPYTAPECFEHSNNRVTHAADMYSFGCLLYEMLSARRPWPGCYMVAIAHAVSAEGMRPPLHAVPDSRCPPALRQLVRQCWEADPRRRPAAAEAAKELALLREQLLSGHMRAAQRSQAQLPAAATTFTMAAAVDAAALGGAEGLGLCVAGPVPQRALTVSRTAADGQAEAQGGAAGGDGGVDGDDVGGPPTVGGSTYHVAGQPGWYRGIRGAREVAAPGQADVGQVAALRVRQVLQLGGTAQYGSSSGCGKGEVARTWLHLPMTGSLGGGELGEELGHGGDRGGIAGSGGGDGDTDAAGGK